MPQFNRLDADDLDLILKTLKEFAGREAPLDKRLKWDETDVCPEDVVRAMLSPEVGLHLVFLPAEYDGMGGGAYDVYRLSTEFAKIDLGLATAMLAVALGTDPIRVGCTHEQKAQVDHANRQRGADRRLRRDGAGGRLERAEPEDRGRADHRRRAAA